MHYLQRVQKSIDFIEEHLSEPITPGDAARQACLSPFHFCRVFHALVGYPPQEYIRRRRLSKAAHDLITTRRKVIDVAFDYQYEAPESFSRAFKRAYGVSPRNFRQGTNDCVLFEKVDVFAVTRLPGGRTMEPRFVSKDGFRVIGKALRTTLKDGENATRIPEFWKRCEQEALPDHIPNRTNPRACLGLSTDLEHEDFTYIICAEVSTLEQVPEGMVGVSVPAAKYAVFTVKGRMSEVMPRAFREIYGAWLPQSGYEFGGTPDFELYDERACADPPEAEIYIPIKA